MYYRHNVEVFCFDIVEVDKPVRKCVARSVICLYAPYVVTTFVEELELSDFIVKP